MAGGRAHPRCAAEEPLASLTVDDVADALDAMGNAMQRQLFADLGLRLSPGRPVGGAAMVLPRLRRASGAKAHAAALALASVVSRDLLDGRGDDALPNSEADLRARLAAITERASPRMAGVLLAVMVEAGVLDDDAHARLLAALAALDVPDPGDEHRANEPTAVAAELSLAEDGDDRACRSHVEGAAAVAGVTLGDLDRVVLGAVLAARSPAPGALTAAEVAGALDELLVLDPERPGSWLLIGVAEGAGVMSAAPDASRPTPSVAVLERTEVLGRLAGVAERGDLEALGELASACPVVVGEVMASGRAPALAGALLAATVGRDPGQAAALLAEAPAPVPGWPEAVDVIAGEAAALADGGDAMAAERLLAAASTALDRWRSGTRDEAERPGFRQPAARLAVARARCRRERRDFAGARALLVDLDVAALEPATRLAAACEAALADAELAGVDASCLPRSPAERARTGRRLARVRDHLDVAHSLDSAGLVANLLLGVLACCEGDDTAAVDHLTAAESALADADDADALLAAVTAHRAVAQLRLLDPGTDDAALDALLGAANSGGDPPPELLVGAGEALAAHGSPRIGEVLDLAARTAPLDPTVATWVAERASGGDPAAVAAAHRLGGDERRSLTDRFTLLAAALAGHGAQPLAGGAEAVAAELDDVVARACEADLDRRWADLLATDQLLRQVLDPAQAEAARVEALRRAGRVAEAREVAKALFYRAAADPALGFDPADLLDLVAELGATGDDLAPLAALVHPSEKHEPAAPAGGPVVVCFAGGNQVQARYQAAINAEVARRHQGQVGVRWFFTGWGSGWADDADRVEAAYAEAHVVVLMTFMRTMLGRRLRRSAGEAGLPWVACTGHGRASVERAVERAISVARAHATR